ncbi:MAG: hypothetical protein HUU01_00350 [Saprospiraceae bacterium]|nr:hypothetical protein [Saprospiraceae bacterium]
MRFSIPFILALLCPGLAKSSRLEVAIPFFSEQLTVAYSSDMLFPSSVSIQEKSLVGYYQRLTQTDFSVLLDDLNRKKAALELNDWLYYDLMRRAVDKIYSQKKALEKELVCWFLLSQSGYDTRLTYLDDRVFVYVFTKEEVFETPMIEENGRNYVNLTALNQASRSQQALYLLNFVAQPKGKAFSFHLTKLPNLSPRLRPRSLHFMYEGLMREIMVQADENVVQLMKSYPLIAESSYIEAPLTATAAASLIPELRELIEGRTYDQAIACLVSFTRSAFLYKEDKEAFGRSKPMIPDEVLYYPHSDCEDRVALFYYLVKTLLDLPMVVVAYHDHLTVGVAIPGFRGSAVKHKGRDFFICDPTGPVNSTEIGFIPEGYEKEPFEIIGSFK